MNGKDIRKMMEQLKVVKRILCLDSQSIVLSLFFAVGLAISNVMPIVLISKVTFYVSSNITSNLLVCLITCIVCFFLFLVSKIIIDICRVEYDNCISRIRMALQEKFNAKMLQMDFEDLDDERFWQKNKNVIHILDSSSKGIGGVLISVFNLVGCFVSMMVLFIMLLSISWCGAGLIVVTLISMFFAYGEATLERKKSDEKSAIARKVDYIFETTNNSKYAKDLRLTEIGPLLNKKMKMYLAQLKSIDKEVILYKFRKRYIFQSVAFFIFGLVCIMEINGRDFGSAVHIANIISGFFLIFGIWTLLSEGNAHLIKLGTELYGVPTFFDLICAEKNTVLDKKMEQKRENEVEWELLDVSYCYRNSKKNSLSNVSFTIEKGSKVAIIGLNGAGKSTLLKCMAGIYHSYLGDILYNGENIRSQNIKDKIGVLLQNIDIYPFSISENVALSDQVVDYNKVDCAINKVNLGEKIHKDDILKGRNITKLFSEEGIELSGGEKRKLLLSRIIYKNPQTVILDEPTANLDILSVEKMVQLIFDLFEKSTIIMITHDMKILNKFDKVIVLDKGRVVEVGTYSELYRAKGLLYALEKVEESGNCSYEKP